MTRDQILSELMEQVRQLSSSSRLLEDVREILAEQPTMVLESLYARNMMPLFMSVCFKEFVSGAAEVPERIAR